MKAPNKQPYDPRRDFLEAIRKISPFRYVASEPGIEIFTGLAVIHNDYTENARR